MPVEVERNESSWIQITTGHFERSRKPAIKHTQLIPLIVNHYELLNNLKKQINVAQNRDQEIKNAINNKQERALVRKKHKIIISGDSHARRCAAELTLNLGGDF